MALEASVKSWVQPDEEAIFGIHNLPFGIVTTPKYGDRRHAGVQIGDYVLDLLALTGQEQVCQTLTSLKNCADAFGQSTLNSFAELGRQVHAQVRHDLQRLLREDSDVASLLKDARDVQEEVLVPVGQVQMHLPMRIGDYTDFYAGYNHAYNVGVLFRGPDNALQPNYTHLPVGYHGRSSSIVVSGTTIARPNGQRLTNPAEKVPSTGPCLRLDYELEMGCFVCRPTRMGESVPVNGADEYIFGYVLLNDWSARDIQAWEYVPLGPFNSKNFGSTISPWIVVADALEPFRTEPLENATHVQEYMQETEKRSVFDINLEVSLTTETGNRTTLAKTSSRNLLWSFPQMLAHHTLGGCPLNSGDMLGSGTISGKEAQQRGSLLEMSEGGKIDVRLSGGETRRFIEDGDTVTIKGCCEKDGRRIGFGDCTGKIVAARPL